MTPPPATGLALGGDQHGATLPTTSSLVGAIADLRADHADGRSALILIAGTLTNAAEIADAHGTHALEVVTAEVARRTLQHPTLRARLLRASPLGGFLTAVVVDRDLARTEIADLLHGVRQLVSLDRDRVWPVVTVGARECRADDEIWSVVRDVRAAVVDAGHTTPGGTRWHEGGASSQAVALDRVRDLAVALAEDPDQLDLHYQPVQDLRSGAIVGAESLLRWHHPEHGPVSPALTVEAAERTGLIVPLGRHVLARALDQTARWVRRFGPTFRMHVNVSPLELREPSYADRLEAGLLAAGVAPGNLLLEITETALLTDEPAVVATLEALQQLGVGIGIDDFGTGYSSIGHLHRLPIDTVKVDRSLVSGIATDAGDFALTRQVLSLVATLGVMIVAEGIESAVEAAHLRSMGCVFGQGYHLGRPVPATDFLPAEKSLGRATSA